GEDYMTEAEAREKVEGAGGSWEVFCHWMRGQTMGLNEDGSVDIYDYDVSRFIRYRCDPANEPAVEWD
ncbi:MAG: hypothetical protein JRN42_08325, partial [Nitrososphaerota archaeon]|nr:hypothetical protein [Nitrososphaerota archaeon]